MSRHDSFALVVGISRYRDEAITPLNYTNADAKAFADLLTDEKICGVPKENVRLLVDEEATLFAIKDSISGWLASRAGADSTAIIFYAGHGDVEPDRTQTSADALSNYLLPYDANAQNLYASALSKEEFQGLVKTVRCKRSVILMDACHSGGVATVGSRKMSVGYSRDLYSSLAEGAGSTVIAAAAPNQLSWEDKELGHGVFTHHLLEALRGGADIDGDGRITMTEVFEYLKKRVPETARRLGGAEQTPVFKADMSEDIVLTVNPERIKELTEAALAKADAERSRIKEMRRKLFDFEREQHLPATAHNLANSLIERSNDSLSSQERGTLELMNAMIAGHVSVETFVRHCETHSEAAAPPSKPASVEEKREKEEPPPIASVAETQIAPTVQEGGPPAKVSSGFNLAMVLVSMLVPLAGLIVGLVYMVRSDQEEKKAGKRWVIVSCVAGVCWFLFMACAAAFSAGLGDPYYY
ncbi:caspase family protein [Pelagicoccus mobilis]|uniref:Caspase family protein n=1 Tax=Pelagicoccus mobilis TaxID=415221 RepID=A0A934VSD4_9BACT|nr:caspase family protein [Pelagicoccus mobilis]MBK1878900.1 caspase family protein [Pelagicoccus mobilis]